MANKQMKRCSTLFIIREKQIKTTIRYHLIPVRMVIIKKSAAAKSLQSCPTLPPHRQQPTRLPGPWDSPGKNTGVVSHVLLQCMKVKSESEVTQSCPTLCDPVGCRLPGSSVHGIYQAIVLEWIAISFSRGSSQPKKDLMTQITTMV